MLPIRRMILSNVGSKAFRVFSAAKAQAPRVTSFRSISISNTLFDETPLKMPSLSPTMTAGTIVKWHKQPGDKISAGDVLCEIQTDKAVMTFEYDDDAVMAKIIAPEGSSEIPCGTLIAVVCGEEDDWRNVKVPTGETEASSSPSASAPSIASKDIHTSKHGRIAPSARNLVEQYGIDVTKITPTGNRGFLLKEDVLAFINANNLKPKTSEAPATPSKVSAPSTNASTTPSSPAKKGPVSVGEQEYIDLEISGIRRTIAKRLTESKSQTPHSYMSIRCEMSVVNEMRASLKSMNIKASVNDILVKAIGIALKQVPQMNCRWNAQTEQTELLSNVDVSIAVATPTGLITPIIFNANRLTISEINSTSGGLIAKAKEGKLQPDEFVGGTFSISNLGMFGIDHFTAVINPPQAAILAVGRSKQYFDENLQVRSRMTIQLSFDARAIEEETAATFLETVRDNLNSPLNLLESDGTSKKRLQSFIN